MITNALRSVRMLPVRNCAKDDAAGIEPAGPFS